MNILKLFQHPEQLTDLTPDAVEQQIIENNPVIIDVRTPKEYRAGHIPGAVSLPLGKESAILEQCPPETPLILICKTGHRSQAAASTVLQLGYTQVAHLKGGMNLWKHAKKPLES